MKPTAPPTFSDVPVRLHELVHGYRTTCVIVAALELGLIEALRAAPVAEAHLAKRLDAHEASLKRFLRALSSLDVIEYRPEGVALTTSGRLLLEGDAAMRERAILARDEYLHAWLRLSHSVKTGDPAFDHVFGMSAWEHRRRNPELNECMNRTMADDHSRARGAIAEAYDFSNCRLVIDVGGGHGALLAEILGRHPRSKGLLFDQPHVVAGATNLLGQAGVLERCEIVGGSFFDRVPSGGDLYLLQRVLHDWSDPHCKAILHNCRAAMEPGTTLLVIENLIPDRDEPSANLVMVDLHMMAMLGGRERTSGEYRSLLEASGFELVRSLSARGNAEILVAMPVAMPP